jgi:hypothetical protein
MIVFEDQLARITEILPTVSVGSVTKTVHFNWGTSEVLTKYLTLSQGNGFPLIWLIEGEDSNDLREPSVTRNAQIVILHESQAPTEFNDYQHQYDYDVILQPILNNLLKALANSGISRFDDTNFRTYRRKNFSMKEIDSSLVYICNAIELNASITFSGISSCINTNIFNN